MSLVACENAKAQGNITLILLLQAVEKNAVPVAPAVVNRGAVTVGIRLRRQRAFAVIQRSPNPGLFRYQDCGLHAAGAFFKSRMMDNRFTATRRDGVEKPMYAAPASRPTGAHRNNCIHGLASRMKVRASQDVPQATPHTGRCCKHPIQRSFLLTGPCRPAM